jgi:hypothetical protein
MAPVINPFQKKHKPAKYEFVDTAKGKIVLRNFILDAPFAETNNINK